MTRVSFFTHVPGHGHPAEAYQDALTLFREADTLGYHGGWVAQHHFSEYGRLPSPIPFLGYAAAATSRLQLGTALVVLPFEHGLRLAQDASVVDLLSGGRVQLGIGSGGDPIRSAPLYRAFGLDPADGVDHTRAVAEQLRSALRGEPAPGGDGLRLDHRHPEPVRNLESRLWQGAQTEQAGAFIGAQGDGLLLARRALNSEEDTDVIQARIVEAYLNALPAGVPPRIAASRALFITGLRAPGIDEDAYWQRVFDTYVASSLRHAAHWPRQGTPAEYERLSNIYRGSAEEIAARLRADRVFPQATELLIQVHSGARADESLASLRAYAAQLIPLLS